MFKLEANETTEEDCKPDETVGRDKAVKLKRRLNILFKKFMYQDNV